MSKVTLTEFFNNDFVNYSSYDNMRKIASVCDGLKNASRKIVSTLLDKNIRSFIKVNQLGAKVCEYRDYLHGNLDDVVVTLGQDFPGTNNIPLVKKKGNFGTRFVPESSAARYIFACGSDELFKLFKSEDDPVLLHQTFEGYPIEPRYFTPTLPMILVNGTEGISSGFASKILPRNPELLNKYIQAKLTGTELSAEEIDEIFTPYFRGFTGTVKKCADNQWAICGIVQKTSKDEATISEVPVGYSLKSYSSVLNKLEDDKRCTTFTDLCDGDKFKFTVKYPRKVLAEKSVDELMSDLKLVRLVTENFTVLDENNKIKVFDNAQGLCDYFIEFKLGTLSKRKESMLSKMTAAADVLSSKIEFLRMVIEKELEIANIPKDKIVANLEKHDKIIKVDDSYNYLLSMPVYSLTAEKYENLQKEFNQLLKNISKLKNKTTKKLWIDDLVCV